VESTDDPLKKAKKLLGDLEFRGFYAEVNRVIWEALKDRLDLPASELNKQHIFNRLRAKGWGESNIYQLEDLLGKCEMNLYTPDTVRVDAGNLVAHAEQVIKYIRAV
jgi:hypothetical protein